MVKIMRIEANNQLQHAHALRECGKSGWQAIEAASSTILKQAALLEDSANDDAKSSREHHSASVGATVKANHANQALADMQRVLVPQGNPSSSQQPNRQILKSAHKKQVCYMWALLRYYLRSITVANSVFDSCSSYGHLSTGHSWIPESVGSLA